MTRRFYSLSIVAAALLLSAQISLRAEATNAALAKAAILENDSLYLRVGEVGGNLAAEIKSAQNTLSATNKTAGTILDLRFADGDDLEEAKAAADLFAAKKQPLAILVNGETRNGAVNWRNY
jgi:hypothetical protein